MVPEPRLRTVARAALLMGRSSQNVPSKFQGAAFIPSARDVQINGGSFSVVEGDIHHHYAGAPHAPTLASYLKAIPNTRKIQSDTLRKATPGTGKGLLQSSRFEVWQDPHGKVKTLWGQGKAGAGKTTLASLVINDLESRAKASKGQICVAYLYIRYTEAAALTIRDLFENLIKQTVERHPACMAIAEETYEQHLREDTQPSEEELLNLLGQFTRIVPATFFVIDALDEAPTGIQLALLKKLSTLRAKLFITSRPLPSIEASFNNADVFPIVAEGRDLDLHIEREFESSPYLQGLLQKGGLSFKEGIMTSIKTKCDGMFLHASLQLNALQQCLSVHDVEQTLAAFPARIEDAYLQTWSRISHQPASHALLAKTILLWVLHAPRSMTIEQIQNSVATSPETYVFEAANVVPEATLISVCCGLVTVDEKSRLVRLVHYTAKSTLEEVLRKDTPHPHSRIASVCLAHLTDRGFPRAPISSKEELDAVLKADPLLAYAHKNWGFHTRNSLDAGSVVKRVTQFIESCETYPTFNPASGFDSAGSLHIAVSRKMPLSLVSASQMQDPNQLSNIRKMSPLARAAFVGHDQAVEHFLALPDIQVNIADSDGNTALHFASYWGREAILNALLNHPDIDVNAKNSDGWTALLRACSRRHEGCTRLLLASPTIDVNTFNNRRTCPLLSASCCGYEGIVQLLLAHQRIQVNVVDNAGLSPLILAAAQGHEGVTRNLLAHPDINVNHHSLPFTIPDTPTFPLCAFSFACIKAAEGTAQLLLSDPRVDLHPQSNDTVSPLLAAIMGGLTHIASALIASCPVDRVHQPGWKNVTALMAAAEMGRADVVKRLLTIPGVRINTVDDVYADSAIKMAAEYGHEEIVRMLLEVPGIDITIKSRSDGHDALSVALAKGHTSIANLLRDFERKTKGTSTALDRDLAGCSDAEDEEVFEDALEFA